MAITQATPAELAPRLKHWSPEKSRRVNLLCRRGVYGQTTLNGQSANWRLSVSREQLDQPVVFRHNSSFSYVQFAADCWQTTVDGQHWQDFPSSQWPLSFILAHEPWLQHFQQLFGIPWCLNSLSATESDLAEPQEQSSVWHWRVEHQGRISAGLVAFDDMALESLAAQPIWHEAKLPTDPVILATPIHLQILLPTLPINTTELMQFAKGDIFIGGLIANLKACTLRHSVSGRSIYSGTLDLKGQILTISQGWLTQSSIRKYPMSDASTTTKSLSSIEDIPVEIAFGLGAITMTLEAFNNLQPGHSFSLNSSIVNDNVTILANGHEIGRGSLIVIGEHLGVELTDVGYNGIQ